MPRPAPAVEETPLILTMHDFDPDPTCDGTTCRCGLPRQNRHHHDAFMGPAPMWPHTPADPTRDTPHSHPCPWCRARPGQPCQTYGGKPLTQGLRVHPARKAAWIAAVEKAQPPPGVVEDQAPAIEPTPPPAPWRDTPALASASPW